MTDEQLYNVVSAWNTTWDVVSWSWLKKCQINLDRYMCLDDDQRVGLQNIIKQNDIDESS